VLPELDVQLKSQPRQVVVGRPGPTDPINIVCRYASESVQRLLPENLQQLFERWPVQIVNESLCLLYVAMTRAVHELHMIVAPRPREKSHPKTFAGVLRGALAPGVPPKAGEVLYEHGERNWDLRKPRLDANTKASKVPGTFAQEVVIKLKPSLRVSRGLQRRSPSSLEGGQKICLEHEMRLETAAAMKRGGLIHTWFELIEWLDDGAPSEETLERAARPLLSPDLDLRGEIASFRKMLKRQHVQEILSRSSYQSPEQHGFSQAVSRSLSGTTELRVERERAFAVRDSDVLLGGSIDRLVTLWCKENLVAAEIVDFKTDQVTGESQLAERIDFYRPQLEAYRTACAKMLRLPVEQILCRVAFVELGIVRRI
jgi:ATP-dependent exoDNAse (exonuclease V) beta subunit